MEEERKGQERLRRILLPLSSLDPSHSPFVSVKVVKFQSRGFYERERYRKRDDPEVSEGRWTLVSPTFLRRSPGGVGTSNVVENS